MTALYTARATATSGRNGHVESSDGLLSLELGYPKELGGNGLATNPEQMFAGGYAACFSNAILFVAKQQKQELSAAPVAAEVGLHQSASGFVLSVKLAVTLDLPRDTAQALVTAAHQVCPYSNAVRGNIEVRVTVNGEPLAG